MILKLDAEYWVCDTALACGETNDNVFKYNPTYFSEARNAKVIIFPCEYVPFETEKEALLFSNNLLTKQAEGEL